MKLAVRHHWHVTFTSDIVSYDVSWIRLGDHFTASGFTVNPLPGPPYGLTVGHTHPGAMTLFTLQHPRLVQYVVISELPDL